VGGAGCGDPLMQKFILLLVFFLVFDGAALAQSGKVALVIGVSKY
jgi:hypothetical protein